MLQRIILGILITILSSCISYDFARRVVHQGNELAPVKIRSIKLGMSKAAVLDLLGDTLIDPIFADNRLEYVYTCRTGSGTLFKKALILYFKNNKLIKICHVP